MTEPPASGRFAGPDHLFPVRVYYEDTDAGGIVYHANYLKFAERARTEMMRLLGAEHSTIRAETGVMWAVRSLAMDFRRPARLDDALVVATTVTRIGGATLELVQTVRMADVPETAAKPPELVRIDLRLACIDRDGRPARLPAKVREALHARAASDVDPP